MPRRVDHTERRRELTAAATRVIATEGLAAATVRRISDEAGHSTGVLTRYFDSKADVILAAVHEAVERFEHRVAAILAEQGRGLRRLEALLASDLPDDDESNADTRLWLDFWAAAPTDPRIAAACRHLYQRWREVLAAAMREAIADGDLARTTQVDRQVDLLVATVDGLCVQAIVDPDRWSPGALREALTDRLAELAGPGPRGPARAS